MLISLDAAITACRGAGQPLLAAMAGVAMLQAHTTPTLPQAQPLRPLAPPPGRRACLPWVPFTCCSTASAEVAYVSCVPDLQGFALLPGSSSSRRAL